jgi:hypothetical protein
VATGLGAFLQSYDPNVSRLVTASVGDRLIGSLTIEGAASETPEGARLRWFILAEEACGRGIGTRSCKTR